MTNTNFTDLAAEAQQQTVKAVELWFAFAERTLALQKELALQAIDVKPG